MGTRLRILALASAALLAALSSTAQQPSGPRIDTLRVTPRGRDVFVRFHLTGALNPELARKIEAGLETSIRYQVRLYRRYPYWFDRFVEARKYRVGVTFDPVTREYVIDEKMDGRPLRRTTTRDFEDVRRMLVSGDNLLVFRVDENEPHRNLYVHMRATFDAGYLFAFIPVNSKTPWKKSKRFNIRTPPGAVPGSDR